ncbi:ATP-binding cassette domain-containing protein [Ferrimonas sp. SCSIO 43195]|uniref:ATP-binding cassette domain-containing protein n=1 Tax=Ferrimonas sp. SCSIO 43195 TaxID=2822844 RepID=UPI002074EC10|nr:ATP-binding cassette domain-containing protein [Ferrimonas sp. SCSIO 43195]USD38986.1 ATP-binding cassette domain-containing protein [Ferrimonas sp. SCSIO 43195]
MTRLVIEGLSYRWAGSERSLKVAQMSLQPGERVLLQGASGSGKSTLLNLVSGVLPGYQGRLDVDGTSLGSLSAVARDRLRAESMGIIFQQFNLLPYLSVAENVLLPLRFSKPRRHRAGNAEGETARLLQAMELDKSLLSQPVTRLSVGQQQRVAAARALIGAPGLILADEPTSALDPTARDRFLALLTEQCALCGSALLLVSHDPAVSRVVDRSYRLVEGAQGTEVLPC